MAYTNSSLLLTNDQKRRLVNYGYVSAKIFNLETYPGWEDYWINNFTWILERASYNNLLKLSLYDANRTCQARVFVSTQVKNIL